MANTAHQANAPANAPADAPQANAPADAPGQPGAGAEKSFRQFGLGVVVHAGRIGLTFRTPAWSAEGTTPDTPGLRWWSVAELAEHTGCTPEQIKLRIARNWTSSQVRSPAGSEPVVDARRNGITHDGETLTLRQWSDRTGVSLSGLLQRLARGRTPDNGLFAPVLFRRGPSVAGPRAHERVQYVRPMVAASDAPPVPRWDDDPSLAPGFYKIDGVVDTLRNHCARYGVALATVRARIKRCGMTPGAALHNVRKPRSDAGVKRGKQRGPKPRPPARRDMSQVVPGSWMRSEAARIAVRQEELRREYRAEHVGPVEPAGGSPDEAHAQE